MKWAMPMVLAAGCILQTGCETLAQQRRRETTQQREDYLVIQENVHRLSGRVEALEFEIERMNRELARAQSEAAAASRLAIDSLEPRIQDAERRIAAVDGERQKDKQAIVDTLSKKMAEAIKQTAASGPARTGRRSDTGYEHVVEPGQTLSEIATAYGVSVQVIMDENNIRDPKLLRAGQKLFIPE